MEAQSNQSSPIPITLLTGFLGSGKTTILNRLLRMPNMQGTAVVINEFGEVGLDHLLVGYTSQEPVLMDGGCMCCTVREDLSATLEDLWYRQDKGEIPPLKRVVIETTGLADPTPILHVLMSDPTVAEMYRLDGVVTTVDAVNGGSTLDHHEEAVKQAAVADRLLITKLDMADKNALRDIGQRLHLLNPGARQINNDSDATMLQTLFDIGLYDPKTKGPDVQRWLETEAWEDHEHHHHHDHDHDHDHEGHDHDHDHDHEHHHHDVNRHDDHIRSYCIIREEPVTWGAFCGWLEKLFELRGNDLLRIKGIVNIAECPGEPIVLHGVQNIFHQPLRMKEWPSDDHRTRVVFITRDIDKSVIDSTVALLDDKSREHPVKLPERAE